MRERLAGWSCFVYLAHKTPTARVETGLKSRRRLKVGCGVRLRSTDFESIHYSAGVSLRVMGGREHIRIETVQDAFVAFFRKMFLLVDFEGAPQEALEVPRSTLKYVYGIQGNRSLIRHEICPLCIKEPTRRKKHRKKCSAQFGRNCKEWDWQEEVRSLVLRKKLDYQPLLLKSVLMQDPDCWSAIPVRTQGVMQLLTGTWQSHVSL